MQVDMETSKVIRELRAEMEATKKKYEEELEKLRMKNAEMHNQSKTWKSSQQTKTHYDDIETNTPIRLYGELKK